MLAELAPSTREGMTGAIPAAAVADLGTAPEIGAGTESEIEIAAATGTGSMTVTAIGSQQGRSLGIDTTSLGHPSPPPGGLTARRLGHERNPWVWTFPGSLSQLLPSKRGLPPPSKLVAIPALGLVPRAPGWRLLPSVLL